MTADFADWTIAVIDAGGGGGGYASLTGPGQTATPGDLVQLGGFEVFDTAGDGVQLESAGQIEIDTTGSNDIIIFCIAGTLTLDGALVQINGTGTVGGIHLHDQTSAGHPTGIQITSDFNGVSISSSGHGNIEVGATGDSVGFYGHGGATVPTVTGSRGGNAALTSLLTALASQGLITNSSTP